MITLNLLAKKKYDKYMGDGDRYYRAAAKCGTLNMSYIPDCIKGVGALNGVTK